MKRKFLIIGILALFAIFMMPVASAASPPPDQRFRAAAYNLSGCDNPDDGSSLCPVVGGRVGAVVFGSYYSDPDADCGSYPVFDVSFSFMKLLPNTQYLAAWVSLDAGGNAVLSDSSDIVIDRYPTDGNGRMKDFINTCDNGIRAYDKTRLDNGYFIGLIPVPS